MQRFQHKVAGWKRTSAVAMPSETASITWSRPEFEYIKCIKNQTPPESDGKFKVT
jgi:hypothetical protein